MNTSKSEAKYPCPNCKRLIEWQNNEFKPFCSKRCKLIDLGAWANEDYRILSNEPAYSSEFR